MIRRNENCNLVKQIYNFEPVLKLEITAISLHSEKMVKISPSNMKSKRRRILNVCWKHEKIGRLEEGYLESG